MPSNLASKENKVVDEVALRDSQVEHAISKDLKSDKKRMHIICRPAVKRQYIPTRKVGISNSLRRTKRFCTHRMMLHLIHVYIYKFYDPGSFFN